MRTSNIRILPLLLVTLLLFGIVLTACSQEPETVEVTRVVEIEVPGQEVEVEVPVPGPEVEVTRVVETIVEIPPSVPEVPFDDEWLSSAHADVDSESFTHWDEDDPAEIPESCAKCHSTPGHQDFLGADGSEAGVVNAPAPIGTTVECTACHNDVTLTKTSVTFPSGIEIANLGNEATCMECHQGRHSTVSVDQGIADAGLTDDVDTVSEDVGFSNIHYYAAAATQFGTLAKGGYEYMGLSYDGRNDHVEGYSTCVECHDMHTLELRIEECQACHTDVQSAEDLANIRMQGSLVDYDGDGDMEEGVAFEIAGLQEMLFAAMQAYAGEVSGTPIVYDDHSYPYFFIDGDGDGAVTEGEAIYPNKYNAWTARLAKAAYNYQVSLKDPGNHAHGGKYVIQLLYDSIADLNEAIATPVDLSTANRIDHGHFAGSEEAFRHWDDDGGVVSNSCAKCHTATGLPQFLAEGTLVSQPASNGLECATCHSNLEDYAVHEVEQVTFPSGATVSFGEGEYADNLCLSCHQGRASTVSVNGLTAGKDPDTVDESLRFLNIHYFAAGATLFGTEVQGGYEYDEQAYSSRNEHVGKFNSCNECHSTHQLEVEVAKCSECHENVETAEDLRDIRESEIDYDGDGDVTEGIAGEIDTMRDVLYAAIQDYAANTAGTPILYDSHSYPYWFNDTNGNGEADPDEVNYGNKYGTWTPRLVRATYNYQDSAKDPGGYAHNGSYVMQLLYDSINDIGGDTAGMTRAAVTVPASE